MQNANFLNSNTVLKNLLPLISDFGRCSYRLIYWKVSVFLLMTEV